MTIHDIGRTPHAPKDPGIDLRLLHVCIIMQLCHLSDIALKHVASSYGLEPHQERVSLLLAIESHLLTTLPYCWQSSSFDDPTAGYGFSLVDNEGLLWLFGGRNGLSNCPIEMLTFNPETGEWTKLDELAGGQGVASRRWHAAHKLGNDKMLIVGGQVWLAEDNSWQDTGVMVQFSFSSRTWEIVPQLGDLPVPRMKCASVLSCNNLYMMSGDDAHTTNYGSIYMFDLESHRWTMRACSGCVPGTSTVESMTVFGSSIFVLAAEKTCEHLQVYRLDTCSFTWSLLDPCGAAPASRQQFAAANYENQWIISGGVLTGTQLVVGGIYSYDFGTCSWAVVVEGLQHEDVDLTKRACHTAAVLNGKLFITGGWHCGWPRLLDGIALSKKYMPPEEASCSASAAAGPCHAAAAALSSGVPNCELPCMVARCRTEHLSYSDCVLVAADGSEYEAHKVVLAAQSLVFDRMFQADMQEAATGRVVIDDISSAALDALLHYLYGGCSSLLPSITVELFAVADKYGISGLKHECILNMQQCLQVDNVAMIAQLASLHELHCLWEACVTFASGFKVQPLVFASSAYCAMWASSPLAAQEFTAQVAIKAAESYQQVAAGGVRSGARSSSINNMHAAPTILPMKPTCSLT